MLLGDKIFGHTIKGTAHDGPAVILKQFGLGWVWVFFKST